jgi:hypothetical protein
MRPRFTDWILPVFTLVLLAFATLQLTDLVVEGVDAVEPVVELVSTSERPTAVATTTPLPSPTPAPIGQSRERPLPLTDIISLPNWDVRVLDMIRGDEAWNLLQAANYSNDTPPDGWEYILIRYRLRSKLEGTDEETLGMHLTGDANILYYSFNTHAVPIDPILTSYLRGGEESEGWEAYLIHENESNLMLVLDDLSDYREPAYFVPMQAGTTITVPTAKLNNIQPTNAGTNGAEPIPFGQMTTSENWQAQVKEQIQGQEALSLLLDVNQFNDLPPEGMEYVMVKVWVRYIGTDSEGVQVGSLDFDVIGRSQTVFERESTVLPAPDFPGLLLYPDGDYEGWIAYFVAQDEKGLSLIFDPDTGDGEDLRYLSLLVGGR